MPELTFDERSKQAAETLDARRDEFARAITERHFELHPELDEKYGPIGRIRCQEDNNYHLRYLAESMRAAVPALFADYTRWANVMLVSRGVPAEDLAQNIYILQGVLREYLSVAENETITAYIQQAIEELPSIPATVPSHFGPEAKYSALAERFLNFLLDGKRQDASRLILSEIESGTPLRDIYLHVFQTSQWEIGRLWQENKLSVAQEHYCTAATQMIMSQLYQHIFSTTKSGHTMIATCVSGDLHEIGIRMISDFFEMEGWDTFYLGANVPPQSVVQTAIERRADVVAISATMTYHIRDVISLVTALRANPLTKDVKIIVGGYPFNVEPELWKKVGANACARDAAGAVGLARELIGASAR